MTATSCEIALAEIPCCLMKAAPMRFTLYSTGVQVSVHTCSPTVTDKCSVGSLHAVLHAIDILAGMACHLSMNLHQQFLVCAGTRLAATANPVVSELSSDVCLQQRI